MGSIRFESAMRTHVGCRRKLNEDAVLSRTSSGLWAVADGMGGHAAGEVASATIVDALESFEPGTSIEASRDFVREALEGAHERIRALAGEDQTMGSTIVSLIADGGRFACGWAGDSRAFLFRSGNLMQLTRDHSLVQDLVNCGMLSPDEAENHPNANVITRAVGVSDALKLDWADGEIEPDDLFLIASDGLTRVVLPAEIGGLVGANGLEAAAESLLSLTLERGAPDNVSLILVRAIAGN